MSTTFLRKAIKNCHLITFKKAKFWISNYTSSYYYYILSLFNQVDLIKIENLFFKGILAKTGSSIVTTRLKAWKGSNIKMQVVKGKKKKRKLIDLVLRKKKTINTNQGRGPVDAGRNKLE